MQFIYFLVAFFKTNLSLSRVLRKIVHLDEARAQLYVMVSCFHLLLISIKFDHIKLFCVFPPIFSKQKNGIKKRRISLNIIRLISSL